MWREAIANAFFRILFLTLFFYDFFMISKMPVAKMSHLPALQNKYPVAKTILRE